jgi:transcription elongation factor GreB
MIRESRCNSLYNKAFCQRPDGDDDDEAAALALAIPAGSKNYIRPEGYQRIKDGALQLIDVDRPEVVRIVHWAASNGDRRSEWRLHLRASAACARSTAASASWTKRMDSAAIVDPSALWQRPGILWRHRHVQQSAWRRTHHHHH